MRKRRLLSALLSGRRRAASGGGGGDGWHGITTTPKLWWRAEDEPTADEATTGALLDQSGNDWTLTNYSSPPDVTMKAGIARTGNKRYGYFGAGNATAGYYTATSFIGAADRKRFTIFLAVPLANVGVGNLNFVNIGGSSIAQNASIRHDTNNNRVESYMSWLSGNNEVGVGITEGQMAIVACRFDVTAGNVVGYRLYVSSKTATGAAVNVVQDNGVGGAGQLLGIGYQRVNGEEISELAYFSEYLSDADFETVMDSLATYYGVTLS